MAEAISHTCHEPTTQVQETHTPLPECKKQPIVAETIMMLDEHRLQVMSNMKFLEIPQMQRLQHITDPSVDTKDVKNNTNIIFNFSFTSSEINTDLYLKTTAGQVLPASVETVFSNGKEYTRTSLQGEFYAADGKRLIIHDNTHIVIGELRETQVLKDIEEKNAQKLHDFSDQVTKQNKQVLEIGVAKGFDPALVAGLFSVFFEGVKNITPEMQEDFVTQIDREIGKINESENRVNKNNLDRDSQKLLLGKMDKTHDTFQSKYESLEISSYQRFLSFISEAEGTLDNYNAIYDGATQNEIKVTNMTLAEVLSYQKNVLLPQKGHTPIGKYQFNYETLVDYIDRFGFSLDQKMDQSFQDKIALLKIEEAGLREFQTGEMSQDIFEVNVAKVWAGFPMDSSERSFHHNIANNKAHVAYSDYSREISQLKNIA